MFKTPLEQANIETSSQISGTQSPTIISIKKSVIGALAGVPILLQMVWIYVSKVINALPRSHTVRQGWEFNGRVSHREIIRVTDSRHACET
ncbi:hypothetical protein OUZ56_016987 [Daphnia magna]|uniref:Uncharacterized protein n=1 Tax=Daphnia magna TaxID=35525 RepID=A0ABR0ARW6_9CRUS|nr:hypothetical protein OUZ56_016987 [Daphnia magna]